ncbi:hypothetical protein ES703_55154 [subsurface metagenome]
MAFRILKFQFENIRNFARLSIEMKNPLIFVGPNDQGKSSILKILNFVFNEIPDDAIECRSIISDDLYKQLNPQRDIGHQSRKIIFDIEIKDGRTRKKFGGHLNEKCARLIITLSPQKTLRLNIIKPKRGHSEDKAIELFKILKEHTCFLLIPAVRGTSLSIFSETIEKLTSQRIRRIFSIGRRGGKPKIYRETKKLFNNAISEILKKMNDEICEKTAQNMLLQYKKEIRFIHEEDILAFTDFVISQFNIATKEKIGKKAGYVDIKEIGNGIQSLILLTLIESLKAPSELDINEYFAIEEPEIFLHPQALRQVFRNLLATKSKCKNIIITTHSPILIDQAEFPDIALVKNNRVFQPAMGALERTEINTKLLNVVNSEILFGDFVILVEGESDKLVLENIISSLIKQTNIKDLYSITIISLGGNTSFAPIIKLMKEYGQYGSPFKWLIVTDKDSLRKNDKNERPILRTIKELGFTLRSDEQKRILTQIDKQCSDYSEALRIAKKVNQFLKQYRIFVLPADIEYAIINELSFNRVNALYRQIGAQYPSGRIRRKEKMESLRRYFGSKGINCEKNVCPKGKKPYLHSEITKDIKLSHLPEELRDLLNLVAKEVCLTADTLKISFALLRRRPK